MGMKDLPDSPKERNTLSIMKATRAMYPLSSNMEMKMNSTVIWGTKETTAPTPVIAPSVIKETSQSATPRDFRPPAT